MSLAKRFTPILLMVAAVSSAGALFAVPSNASSSAQAAIGYPDYAGCVKAGKASGRPFACKAKEENRGWDLLQSTSPVEPPGNMGSTAVSGRFWIYEHDSYRGHQKSYNANDANFKNDEWDGTNTSVNDKASSAWNNTNRYGNLFVDTGYVGTYIWFPPNSASLDLEKDFGLGDEASSIKFTSS
ncbi:peptidase inhibitor family I36 protein [[Actinomadura] parvosata]|uniref:peptidase inhibitor family I36 protein n=1 Tax=[Actinomadura] parvosata TaxID=1955412 RepID=UPI001648E4BC